MVSLKSAALLMGVSAWVGEPYCIVFLNLSNAANCRE